MNKKQYIRVIVEKKQGFQTQAKAIQNDLNESLGLQIKQCRLIRIYDVFGLTISEVKKITPFILAESATDTILNEFPKMVRYVALEPLPGQFDARADASEQTIQFLLKKDDIVVKTADLFIFTDDLLENELSAIKRHLINPVEKREIALHQHRLLSRAIEAIHVESVLGFNEKSEEECEQYLSLAGLSLSLEDLKVIQTYFRELSREPTVTEINVLDAYWSDHCRHRTFYTELIDVALPKGKYEKMFKDSWESYSNQTKKPHTLMDIGTLVGKRMKEQGLLPEVEESEEVNAISIGVDVDVNGKTEKYWLMFKNETHNHPTEIEPYGGASTCIGGAIRDPLSGRAYVYQAIRVSGAGNVWEPSRNTLEGKLPQRVIARGAAEGFSSYGNQIGIATTLVKEIYHPSYVAKRLEIGAVVGAVKQAYVQRNRPIAGDVVLLLGGRTGADGIKGASGSSRSHNEHSLTTAVTEVQKGNPPTERKIQRLFRNPNAISKIKKCNDFGAGGIAVAIGEIADGVCINLDNVSTKQEGMDGTAITLSESQERMAIVLDQGDVESFIALAHDENLEATAVATITDDQRLVITHQGKMIVDLKRSLLDSSGAKREAIVQIKEPKSSPPFQTKTDKQNFIAHYIQHMQKPNIAGQKGLIERFDSSIGRSSVLMPLGGKYQATEEDVSVQVIPTEGITHTASLVSFGFQPEVFEWSPYHGAYHAIAEAIAKAIAAGAELKKIRFSFQEYFQALNNDPHAWGLPTAALLGAYQAQIDYGCPAIGGKDSMSGSYQDIHVVPTLVAFAFSTIHAKSVISSSFKASDEYVYLLSAEMKNDCPNAARLSKLYQKYNEEIKKSNVTAASALKSGGLAEALAKMSFGNQIGVHIESETMIDEFFDVNTGAIVFTLKEKPTHSAFTFIGRTINDKIFYKNQSIDIDELYQSNQKLLSITYPYKIESCPKELPNVTTAKKNAQHFPKQKQPLVCIPVFPGTNCEYDTEDAFIEAGAKVRTIIFKNRTIVDIEDSLHALCQAIDQSDILVFSGGFSAGDEPDGAGKFIAAVINNDLVSKAISRLRERKGLILGICNGFQALVKSGLLPFGEVMQDQHIVTLFRNDINHHVARMAAVAVANNHSPWLKDAQIGALHHVPLSHGEGKFFADESVLNKMIKNGQIATQYVDAHDNPTMVSPHNPNGSWLAVEGITSEDGLIFGRMGHPERMNQQTYQNVPHLKLDIFKNAVNYFTKGGTNDENEHDL